MKKLIFLFALATTIIACKKETDSENPVITIISPTAGEEFDAADSVTVNFEVSDVDLHEVGFVIIRTGTTDTLYNFPADHVHDNPFVFNEKLEVLVGVHTDATLIINAEDHNGNASSRTVNFHIHPII